jgi:hypothetical protein
MGLSLFMETKTRAPSFGQLGYHANPGSSLPPCNGVAFQMFLYFTIIGKSQGDLLRMVNYA